MRICINISIFSAPLLIVAKDMNSLQFKFGILLMAQVVVVCAMALGSSYEEEISLSPKEKGALDKFKALVIPKIPRSSYIQNYIKDDLFFVKWLRGKSFNVPAAVEMFLNHLKWREAERMDTIEEEDWSEYKRDFPLFVDTFDKEGRPAAEIWFSDWDARSAVLAGKSKRLQRWLTRVPELQTRRLYKARASGTPVGSAVTINDEDGFNLVQHACTPCMTMFASLVESAEKNYPFIYSAAYMVNVPSTFGVFLRTIRPFFSQHTARSMKIYSERADWIKVLDKEFSKDQRSVRFGGSIIRDAENS